MDNTQMTRNVTLPAQISNAQFANRRFATVVPQHVFASVGDVGAAAHHPPAAALEHTPVTMRSPQIKAVSARSLPGPAVSGRQGQPGAAAGTQAESAAGAGRLPAASTALRPGTENGGRQPGRPTDAGTAALPPPWHSSGGSPHAGTAAPPEGRAFQERQPGGPGAAHPRVPVQAAHPPPQAFHPSAQAFRAPAQAFHPPAQA